MRAQPTRLLGRSGDLEEVAGLLRRDGVRLLTLTGPAGVGKTRLAVEVGDRISGEFAQGVAFVDLSPIRDPSRVAPALAAGVGLQDVESPRLPERLYEFLRDCQMLIVLDNFEQVLPAATWLADLLSNCRGHTLLVTSREALRLRWEHTYRVEPLDLPDPDHLPPVEELARVPAVALFVERARATDPKFSLGEDNARAVAELCVRLDGLPLAIELAAARTSLLSPQGILDRLEDRLSLLRWEARDLPERQQTLRSAIGWSHDLLNEQEQALYRRLGVFEGGFTMDAARAVACVEAKLAESRPVPAEVLDGLGSLVDKSLVQPEVGGAGEVRYRMLESVREYALEQLRFREEAEEAGRSHALHFLALAERAEPELIGREQRAWFFRLEQEHDNLRAALRWLTSRDDVASALRLAVALGYYWMRGYYTEGRRFLEDLVGRSSGAAAEPETRALALDWLGILLLFQGEMARAQAVLEEGLAVAHSADDPRSVTVSLLCLGIRATFGGDRERGSRLLEEALERSRRASDAWLTARALHELGVAALYARDHERAERLLEDSRAGYRSVGDERSAAEAMLWLSMAAREQGGVSGAAVPFREALGIAQRLQDRRLLNMCVDVAVWLVVDGAGSELLTRLMGVSEALRQITGLAHSAWEHAPFAPAITELGVRLDDEDVAAARTEAYAMSLEQMADLVLEVLDEAFGAGVRRAEPGDADRHGVLSPRETEVLRLVAEGLSNGEVAKRLFIAERTVRYHLKSIFGKLDASNRTEAVALAKQQGLF